MMVQKSGKHPASGRRKPDLGAKNIKMEVEIKVAVKGERISAIKRKLKALGYSQSKKKTEQDIYFTSQHRDFISTRECLRIRSRENFAEMTYKGKTNEDMRSSCQFWKKEFNLTIDKKLIEAAVDFLSALEFSEVVRVVKKRQEFKRGDKTVTIDEIMNAGYFIEIESMAAERDRGEAMEENLRIKESLGLAECGLVDEPYRDIVMKNAGK